MLNGLDLLHMALDSIWSIFALTFHEIATLGDGVHHDLLLSLNNIKLIEFILRVNLIECSLQLDTLLKVLNQLLLTPPNLLLLNPSLHTHLTPLALPLLLLQHGQLQLPILLLLVG
jgi:hypothetical protein